MDIFYGNYNWHFTSEEVSTEPYTGNLIINETNNREIDEIGKVLYGKNYEVTYDGFTTVPAKYDFQDNKAVFKYTIKNTSDSLIDFNLVGYDMRGYIDNCLLGSATYSFDDTVDGYLNIYKLKEIQPGMSAKIYVAFDTKKTTGNFYNVFDVGYLSNEVLGSVNIDY